ncbi:hypothetical protein SAMN06269173_111128 [Hymenobacter mucosus]|uniref:Uncharacterized protein n=1 Tax=Hymenobacter mucosus TaxID=1411120 RepID=A0A239AB97_9BACT|nr:hypothetical protein SAMN06269173_111128 [Hymenobacter mucosus]
MIGAALAPPQQVMQLLTNLLSSAMKTLSLPGTLGSATIIFPPTPGTVVVLPPPPLEQQQRAA